MLRKISVLSICLVLVGLPVHAAEDPGAEEDRVEHYPLRYLSPHEARMALVVVGRAEPACEARVFDDRRVVQVHGPEPCQRMTRTILARLDVAPQTQDFRLLLLGASRDGNGLPKDLPDEAREALRDLQQLMPFGGFQLIDAALVRVAEGESARGSIDDNAYDIKVGRMSDGQFPIRFRTASGEAAAGTKEPAQLDTSLLMGAGETVVLGTSPAGQDEAHVYLLTAIARP